MTPRLIIASPASGQGKTTAATGLMAALARRGLKVQGFKAGPDYIDPVFHTAATGRPSRNLDTWMMGEDLTLELFERAAGAADIAVIEGVMGLFDGYSGSDDAGSAAHLARLLNAPVLLVVDGWAMARSVAALVHGFMSFDPRVRVAGVLLNNLAGEGHYRFLAEALAALPVPVVGWVQKQDDLTLPERHLGLAPSELPGYVDRVGEAIAVHVDLEAVVRIARSAGPVPAAALRVFTKSGCRPFRLAVARDEAFWFYYADGLDFMAELGAEIVYFSPLTDQRPPAGTQGIYLGGGYPELYAAQLSDNRPMREWLAATRVPIYAECGGLMYLSRTLIDLSGNPFPLVGRLPTDAVLAQSRLQLGYVNATAARGHLLARAGETVRGHEYHISRLTESPAEPAWLCQGRFGAPRVDGFALPGLLATYVHLHFAANPDAARHFADAASLFESE